MKIIDPINVKTFDLKEAISTMLGARLQLGQTLYFTFQTINKNMKKHKYTLAQFLRIISFSYPRMSRRSLSRSYRVFERLVVECGFWITDLQEIDFILMSKVAECRNIMALTRREIIVQICDRIEAGDSYAQISKKLDKTLAALRDSPPRLPEVVLDTDHRLADMKMDFRLVNSAKDPPPATPQLPADYFDLGMPRVVLPGDKPEPE
ncbi:MAG: hypothetical protein IIA59_08885 [Candidatus Marinimicrobia bacterium]|nr:hypothetical protein [Candidatus Neomarinimicrobiota bacterium]